MYGTVTMAQMNPNHKIADYAEDFFYYGNGTAVNKQISFNGEKKNARKQRPSRAT